MSVFLDSNFFLYAYSKNQGAKEAFAKKRLREFWEDKEQPSLSIQVLQEVHFNLVKFGYPAQDSWELLRRYLAWPLVENTRDILALAMETQIKYQISFWDASIIAAAKAAGACELWTEDLNTGQDYGGLVVVNPFDLT